MSPRDVPGRLHIGSLFPWLAQLAPATEAPRPDASPTSLAPRPAATDLPRAA